MTSQHGLPYPDPPPPTNPGKPEVGRGNGRAFNILLALVIVVVLGGIVAAALLGHRTRPTPDEFCAGHGGVRYLSAGGWATPDTATCRDGHAGNVYP